jgi:hypothetical protein
MKWLVLKVIFVLTFRIIIGIKSVIERWRNLPTTKKSEEIAEYNFISRF